MSKRKKKKYEEVQSGPEMIFMQIFDKLGWIDKYDIMSQYVIPDIGYRVDFFFKNLNLIIEIDAKQHQSQEQIKKDRIRDINLMKNGYYVFRISWEQFKENPKDIIKKLVDKIRLISTLKPFQQKK